MDDCPFCHIGEREEDCVLEEGQHVFVILSDPRLVPGHTLVIPKRHLEQPSEMNQQEREELFQTLLEWQVRIMERYSSGCDIRQNCRPFQSEDWIKKNHIHFHLQPRELNDEIYERFQKHEREMFAPLTRDERERFMALLSCI